MVRATILAEELGLGSLVIEVDGCDAWRDAARKLLLKRVKPSDVAWLDQTGPRQLWLGMRGEMVAPENASHDAADRVNRVTASESRADQNEARIRVPARFTQLAKIVACHRDRRRWDLLYRVLWRLTHGEPNVLELLSDDDVFVLLRYEREVARDLETMKTDLRFRRLGEGPEGHYIAWYAPQHRVLELVAPFLQRRFGVMRWSLFTPDASIHWDGEQLRHGAGQTSPALAAETDPSAIERWWREVGREFVSGGNCQRSPAVENGVRTQSSLFDSDETSNNAEIGNEYKARDFHDVSGDSAVPQRSPTPRLQGPLSELAAVTTSPPSSARKSAAATSAEAYLPTNATSLSALRRAAACCQGCELRRHATQTVFGAGPRGARIVFVGEQPGDYEDRRGEPFVGPAGKLFDEALAEAGLDRSQVYVTNAVKHFKWTPRGKRRLHAKPGAREIAACRPWLEAELLAIQPEVLVCLGATAVAALLGPGRRVTQEHGKVFDSEWAPKTLATFHPSAILRASQTPEGIELRKQFVADLKRAGRLLTQSSASPTAGKTRSSKPKTKQKTGAARKTSAESSNANGRKRGAS